MGRLIDDLLSFSRLGRAEVKETTIAMGALANEAYAEAKKVVPDRDIEFVMGTLPDIEGDSDLIRQVWANLFTNAVKFTGKREKAKIEVGSISDGKSVTYYVKDNGAGFDMQYVGKLFGVFQRLHSVEEFEGTGIGLANVKRIVERHGGSVRAEGKVGEGATFYFTLPKK
jgi:light-regulated signal transduction histidine kinase (bacteriophytochrome)